MPNILSQYLEARAQADEEEDQKKKRRKTAAEKATEDTDWPGASPPAQVIGVN